MRFRDGSTFYVGGVKYRVRGRKAWPVRRSGKKTPGGGKKTKPR